MIKYLTEYEKEDGKYAGHIYAESQKEAEKLAKKKGETVIGFIPTDCNDCETEGELSEPV